MNIIFTPTPTKIPISNGNIKHEINVAKPGIKSLSAKEKQENFC